MGDFRKKISCKPISKKNISRMKIPTLKKKTFMVYNSGKKNLTPVYVREKNDITRGLEKKFLPKANHS